MLKPFIFLLALLQGVCLAREGKRILLNDPALIEQRLSHLEQKIQTLESENRLLKDRQNQYEAAQIGKINGIPLPLNADINPKHKMLNVIL